MLLRLAYLGLTNTFAMLRLLPMGNRDKDLGPHPLRDNSLTLFDVILADAGIKVVLSGVQTPRMGSILERWIQTCRHELLDRTLIWNQRHLLHALREYEQFYNNHRPTKASPTPDHCNHRHHRSPIRTRSPGSTSADAHDWAASSTSTTMPPELHG